MSEARPGQFLIHKLRSQSHLDLPSTLHALSEEQLTSPLHPDFLKYILYLVPFLFAVITFILLFKQNRRTSQNFLVKSYPKFEILLVVEILGLLGLGVIGGIAVFKDTWNTREWILYASILFGLGIISILYALDSKATLVITIFVFLGIIVLTQWLFIEFRPEAKVNTNSTKHAQAHAKNIISQSHLLSRHFAETKSGFSAFVDDTVQRIDRIFLGFSYALFIYLAVQVLGQILVHVVGVSEKGELIFFWIVAPLAIIGVFVWNLLVHANVLELSGYILASVLLFLASILRLIFFSDDVKEVKK